MKNKIISIDSPEDGKLRTRKVVTRSRHRSTKKYPSWKVGRMVQCESENELNAARLLDAYPLVIEFYEQPYVITYILDNEQHKHYPDFLVKFEHRNEIWEIKEKKEASQHEIQIRTEFMKNELPKFGYEYQIILAEDLAEKTRLSTVLTILKFGRQAVSLYDEEKIRILIKDHNYINWKEVTDGLIGKNGRNIICRLLLEGVLTFDINKGFNQLTNFFWLGRSQRICSWDI